MIRRPVNEASRICDWVQTALDGQHIVTDVGVALGLFHQYTNVSWENYFVAYRVNLGDCYGREHHFFVRVEDLDNPNFDAARDLVRRAEGLIADQFSCVPTNRKG